MGVPKFFRWLSERYPCISVFIDDTQIPEFDCLYLDMNGIIHTCSHPDDNDISLKLTEDVIFKNIFNYVDHLLNIVKPKELFFMAVDGVAPRAKMNQQRCRRFKSALERKNRENAAIIKGDLKAGDKQFDSNAITPGTLFMDRLNKALKVFVQDKVKSDINWQRIEVIFSGHETPGEGEHKIQEFIRYRRTLPNYNPNTRHCLYGLDADLIILGLASHEPYFALLREEVIFLKKKDIKATTPTDPKFYLLYISLLRDYISCEFECLKADIADQYDLEKLIDDWIIMTFFVGNDFIPHIPNLHIHSAALPLLWQTYKTIRPSLDSNLCDKGKLNIRTLLKYTEALNTFDFDNFQSQYEDMKWMMGKTGKKMGFELENLGNNDELGVEERALENFDFGDEFDSTNVEQDEEDIFNLQYVSHKRDYYYSKMGIVTSDEILSQMSFEYVRAMQWISYYYFYGVPSWDWFYPHHYAPYISDLQHLDEYYIENGISFQLNKPFHPFEQLLAVLPPDSVDLLPSAYHGLMTDKDSEIIDFYPKSFKTDINGKKAEWEALVLIPFIDESRLLTAMSKYADKLTQDEVKRNEHGSSYSHKVKNGKMIVEKLDMFYFRMLFDRVVHHILPKTRLDLNCRCFPTLFSGTGDTSLVNYDCNLEKINLKIFESNSRNICMVIKVLRHPDMSNYNFKQDKDCIKLASKYLNKTTYANWPAIVEVKIISVSFLTVRKHCIIEDNEVKIKDLTDLQLKDFSFHNDSEKQRLSYRKGIVVPTEDQIIVEGIYSQGKQYLIDKIDNGEIFLRTERIWNKPNNLLDTRHKFLQQLIILKDNIQPYSIGESDQNQCYKISELIQNDSIVFCLDPKYYGNEARVSKIDYTIGNVKIKLMKLYEPNYSHINPTTIDDDYLSIQNLSDYTDFSPYLLSRLTGYLPLKIFNKEEDYITGLGSDDAPEKGYYNSYMKYNKINIGLCLKDTKNNFQIPDYATCKESTKFNRNNNEFQSPGMTWYFTFKVIQQLDEYRQKYPVLFDKLQSTSIEKFDQLTANEIFGTQGNLPKLFDICEEINKYLKSLSYRNVPCLSYKHKIIRTNLIKQLEQQSDDRDSYLELNSAEIDLELPLNQLWTPHLSLEDTEPDNSTEYQLMDRVVCINPNFVVPLGYRGVVIGIEPTSKDQLRLEVLFDKPFPMGKSIRGSSPQCYRLSSNYLINVTHGYRNYGQRLISSLAQKIKSMEINNNNGSTVSSSASHNKEPLGATPLPSGNEPKAPHSNVMKRGKQVTFKHHNTTLPPPPPQCQPAESIQKQIPITNIQHQSINTSCNKDKSEQNFQKNIMPKSAPSDIQSINPNAYKSMEFIQRCDQAFRKNTLVVDYINCPPAFIQFMTFCRYYNIMDPRLFVTTNTNNVCLGFSSNVVNIAEFEECNMEQALIKMTHMIDASLCAPQNYPPMVSGYYNNNQQQSLNMYHYNNNPYNHKHIYVPQQFYENPFMQSYKVDYHYQHNNAPSLPTTVNHQFPNHIVSHQQQQPFLYDPSNNYGNDYNQQQQNKQHKTTQESKHKLHNKKFIRAPQNSNKRFNFPK